MLYHILFIWFHLHHIDFNLVQKVAIEQFLVELPNLKFIIVLQSEESEHKDVEKVDISISNSLVQRFDSLGAEKCPTADCETKLVSVSSWIIKHATT